MVTSYYIYLYMIPLPGNSIIVINPQKPFKEPQPYKGTPWKQHQLHAVRTQKKPQPALSPELILEKIQAHIVKRKQEIYEMLRIDKAIKADTYDNVARLREVQKIEKLLRKS